MTEFCFDGVRGYAPCDSIRGKKLPELNIRHRFVSCRIRFMPL